MCGTRWRIWLNHYATSRKVSGSIPDEAIEFLLVYVIFPSVLWYSGRLNL
jgi:hypothetical protein